MNLFGSGTPDNVTTTVTSEPWRPTRDYLIDVMREGSNRYDQGPDWYPYPNISGVAPLDVATEAGLKALRRDGYASEGVRGAADYALGVYADPNYAPNINQFLDGGMGGGTYTAAGQPLIRDTVQTVQGLAGESALLPTANVNSADALQAILDGRDGGAFQEYMNSSNQNIADQIIRNNLLPQQVQQLMGGSYGGSAGMNIGRAAAVDIADTVGRSNNALILDQQGKQLQAADIVRGAQQGVDTFNTNVLDAGIQGAGVLQQGNVAAMNAEAQNRSDMIRAAIAADQLRLQQANDGTAGAATWDNLQYADAARDLLVGGAREQQAQQELDDMFARALYNQGVDDQSFAEYANLISGIAGVGGTSTTVGPAGASSAGGLAGALGGGLAGAGGVSAINSALGAGTISTPVGWAVIGAGALLGSGILGD